jgi:type IV secretory pathway VirB4 component
MILQNNETTVCELNLDGIDYATEALAGTEKSVKAMNKAIASSSDRPEDWLRPFYQMIV